MSRVFVGMATLVMLVNVPGVVSAESATAPRVEIVRGAGAVTVSVQEESLAVSQKLTPRSFDLALVRANERIRFTGDVNGRVSVTRGRESHAFSIASPGAHDLSVVRGIIAGSPALAAFDRLMASTWARTDKNAAVFASAHAIVSLLQGKTTGSRAVVESMGRRDQPRLTTVALEGPGECWYVYTRDVVAATYDLEACMAESRSSLNPLRTIWCSYSYNLRTSFAFIWLMDCHGL